tara:strand:- start:2792 stop:3052 length:261 start_codon:yes stop_codon:yes gene_type:complete
LQRLGQHFAEVFQEAVGSFESDPPSSGVDTGPPECLVGVNIADTSDGSLRQELGLDPPATLGQRAVEHCGIKGRVKGFRSQSMQGW